ncbi:MAG TPA: leucyl aminopeptidase [Symbiobacteriaceae bacterium]|nr:leucyl aminopeptidase [Symbiobacteriaceae bacterium]
MQVQAINTALTAYAADVLILLLTEGAPAPAEVANLVGPAIEADFKAGFGKTALVYANNAITARKLLLVGLGKAEKLNLRLLRKAAAIGARAARESGAASIAFVPPTLDGFDADLTAQSLTEGALHGLYRFRSFKSVAAKPQVESIAILGASAAAVARGEAFAAGVNKTRGLAWLPGNHLTATDLANEAAAVCGAHGIEIEIYDKKGCEELGLGLLLAVNQGSVEEPRFVVMRYKGNGGQGPWLGLVGKGVTFDTGGISIKPTEGMWDMKYDMAGAAAVVGAMETIGRLKPKADILAIIGCTDNMPDGGAYKPGDVIVGLSGKTVEIRSTDAEGRLVLGDALAYAVKQGAAKLITASTLTGAAQISLGPIRFGMVSNNETWQQEVYQAADSVGERGWPQPMDEEYDDLFDSPIADMANSGVARAAGMIVGGRFLLKHVSETPTVHLDIAITAWNHKGGAEEDLGATGTAVRTFVAAAERWAK